MEQKEITELKNEIEKLKAEVRVLKLALAKKANKDEIEGMIHDWAFNHIPLI